MRAGDILVVTELDRLARSIQDARDIVDELIGNGVKLQIGAGVHDPDDPVGRLLLQRPRDGAYPRAIRRARDARLGCGMDLAHGGRFCPRSPYALERCPQSPDGTEVADEPGAPVGVGFMCRAMARCMALRARGVSRASW